ncbi:MAG TPA: histidine kinase dimerization/phosphoacceptor domain -containing protein [Microvirga sp.]|jgi:PAS domain S-box-containing protein|nr:histidine kinase dimerization/phosphoacceptor domain -containing protein [Microvirga sp.]
MLDSHSTETEFRILADNAPVMIWRAGPDKLCDWFNKPWLDFTGRSLEQELGNGWAERVHPDDFDRCLAIYTGSFDRREPFSMEYRLQRHDGAYRWLLDNGRPFYREGVFAGYFGSCLDVTEQREHRERLERLAAEREALLREVHHRVNNNLQTLSAILRLRRRTADEASRSMLDELGARVTAMSAVQRYLHSGEDMASISVRDFLASILSDITAADPGLPTADFTVTLSEAANLGLAVAEIVGLMDGETPELRVGLDAPDRMVLVQGRAGGSDSDFPLQLVRAYARAAGATLNDFADGDGTIRAEIRLGAVAGGH